MSEHEKINYLELPAKDMAATKAFYQSVFDWQFTDYGPEYIAFGKTAAGLDGGFYLSNHTSLTEHGSALIVFYSQGLETTQQRIEAAGGQICKAIFAFPGGRRFHFLDPNGNELAVWSDQ